MQELHQGSRDSCRKMPKIHGFCFVPIWVWSRTKRWDLRILLQLRREIRAYLDVSQPQVWPLVQVRQLASSMLDISHDREEIQLLIWEEKEIIYCTLKILTFWKNLPVGCCFLVCFTNGLVVGSTSLGEEESSRMGLPVLWIRLTFSLSNLSPTVGS